MACERDELNTKMFVEIFKIDSVKLDNKISKRTTIQYTMTDNNLPAISNNDALLKIEQKLQFTNKLLEKTEDK